MPRKKIKKKKVYRRLTFWAGVLVLGAVIGLAVQFTRAWVEPSGSVPGAENIAAPLNTAAVDQIKGNATAGKINAADFCLNSDPTKCLSSGGGPSGGGGGIYESCCFGGAENLCTCASGYKGSALQHKGAWSPGGSAVNLYCRVCQPLEGDVLVNGQHTASECTGAGGTVVQDGSAKFCQFNGSTPPAGWTKYQSWSETSANTCNGSHTGSCDGRTSCTTGNHGWANVSTEICGYKNETTGQTWNPQYSCASTYPCGESSCPYTYCSASDASNCYTFSDDMGTHTWCDPSCSLDSGNSYGCGSYSSYCSTANATCTANATKIGCY